jgi:hypothetical protein
LLVEGKGDMTEGQQAHAEDLLRVFRQVVGVVLISWQRILRVSLIAATLAILVSETVACFVTGSFPPPPLTHLVAVSLALALGYGVSLTMLTGMLLKGGVRLIRQLEGDVEIGAHAASVFAQREVGALGAGIRRFFGKDKAAAKTMRAGMTTGTSARPAGKARPSIVARTVAATPVVAAVGRDNARNVVSYDSNDAYDVYNPFETFPPPLGAKPDTRRDPDDAIMRTPAPAFQSLPVRAAQLPRIEWTYDDRMLPRSVALSSAPPAMEQAQVLAAPLSAEATASLETPVVPDSSYISDELGRTPDVPGLIRRGWYRPGRVTRPLPAVTRPLPAITRPLPASDASRPTGGARSGGLWERVSQALIGQSGAPDPESSGYDSNSESNGRQLPLSATTPDDIWLNE